MNLALPKCPKILGYHSIQISKMLNLNETHNQIYAYIGIDRENNEHHEVARDILNQ